MHQDDHDQGPAADLRRMLGAVDRRRFLAWLSAAAVLPSVACGDGGSATDDATDDLDGDSDLGDTTASDTDPIGETDVPSSCEAVPEETEGPYPGDGSNGPDALALSGIVRSDIRSSLGDLTGTAEGVLLRIRLRLVDAAGGCAPLAGAAVYLWHCDRDGDYSMYTRTDQNWLRGVQIADADGWVEFLTVFPGCYDGRWPHVHYEVYPSSASTSSARDELATSQLALPKATCRDVYATDGYEASVANLARVDLATDNVFRDGADAETPTVTGSVDDGYVATLMVGVA